MCIWLHIIQHCQVPTGTNMANSVGHVEVSSMLNKDFHVKNGSCITCETKVQSAGVITCNLCSEIFHAVCPNSNRQNKICSETLLRNYSQNSTKENFMWYCNACLTLYEHDRKCGIQEKLNALMVKFEMLTNAFSKVQGEVSNNTKSITTLVEARKQDAVAITTAASVTSSGSNNGGRTWDMQAVIPHGDSNHPRDKQRDDKNMREARVKRKKANSSLIIKCSEGGDTPLLAEIRDVAVSNGIPINQVSVTANNNAVIALPNEEVREKLKPLLAAKPSLQQHEIANVQSKLPRVTILDVCDELDENDFIQTVKMQNPEIAELINEGETFSDIYIKNKVIINGRKNTQINVTVSEKIRKLLNNRRNRLYIGLNSCRVVDKINVLRCYKCHNHDHLAKNCDRTPCCGYCASKTHVSDECTLKNDIRNNISLLKCVNCENNNDACSGHSVYWPLCPANRKYRGKMQKSSNNAGFNLNSRS